MAKSNRAFAIDDTLATSDNLAAYAQLLEAMDGPLGAVLSPYLASLAAGRPTETAAIWDALYAATALLDSSLAPPKGESDGIEGAA
jgi:hypothetical protein